MHLRTRELQSGLGMTAQAVNAINDGTKLDIIFFEEGSPLFNVWSGYNPAARKKEGMCKKVFDFMIDTYSRGNEQ